MSELFLCTIERNNTPPSSSYHPAQQGLYHTHTPKKTVSQSATASETHGTVISVRVRTP